MAASAEIQFGREICGNLAAAESREWLVTNGIGGYASGTIAGSQTRRYHGLLMAALQPPAGRTLLVSNLDEIVRYGDGEYSLATHHWASGAIDPRGYELLEDFRLEGTTPVWTYALADALLEKRVWMQQGENTTFVQYTLVRASGALELNLKALVNYRDYHSMTHESDWQTNVEPVEHGVKVGAYEGAVPFYLRCIGATCEPRHEWYVGSYFPEETARGLDDREDRLFAALFQARLEPNASVTAVLSTEANASLDEETVRAEEANRIVNLFQDWQAANEKLAAEAAEWLWQLVLGADQFIVKRSLPEEADGRSILAGYHWFGDWGRDIMISLPGLTLATGRPEVAKKILLSLSRYVDKGMLPNNFPDAGGKPQYNTVDASLWYFEAVCRYYETTKDTETLQQLFPVLAGMIEAHAAGTRYNIHVDPADGLLYAGDRSVQLTWMDAKIGDWVVTPRIGKAVEINALWINALSSVAGFATLLRKPAQVYEKRAAQAKQSFRKFWNNERNCCYDVIQEPGVGNDAALRPNQIFAVSLPVSPLTPEQQKAVVDVCAKRLLTSYGLRSLAQGEPGYAGHYGGGPGERDAAYHQGTVWSWLLGPFALAHFRVYRDKEAALRFLEPLGRQIYSAGLGSISEIFDGDPPFAARGCIAQAWSVAELLRAWTEISAAKSH